VPPFFIPIIAFILWVFVVFSYLPLLKLDLTGSDPLVASQFFISNLILVFAWALSGPVTAAILSILSALVAVYMGLAAKEPSIFLQLLFYTGLFIAMLAYLYQIQQTSNDKKISLEKLTEDVHLTEKEIVQRDVLREALQNKIDRFLNLHGFSEELKSVSEVKEAAQKIVDEIRVVLSQAEECVLYLVDASKQELFLVASAHHQNVGALSARRQNLPAPSENSFLTGPAGAVVKEKTGTVFDQWVMKRSQGVMIEDVQNDFRFSTESGAGRLHSVCASPLIIEKKVLGVVRASSEKTGCFNADDLRLLDIFSNLGAVTLKNILLYEKMKELAIHDSLTGLYLNRYFQERLSEEIQRASLHQSSFSLVLLDIDYFKRYNDEYGHSAGDIVLKSIAAVIRRCLSPVDLAARYGGEEFILLFPNKNLKEAAQAAETIRQEVEKSKFSLRRTEGKVTISVGVTAFPPGGRTREALVGSADRNLYEAKRLGRNRVCGSI